MKTLIILSDSHGRKAAIQKIEPLFAENDFIIHLGDGAFDMRDYRRAFPEKTFVLSGNCEPVLEKAECILEQEGVRIFCCHGHRHGVKEDDLSRLASRAKERGCTVALYGHTHRADIREVDGVLCINPGAIGSYTDPSYCYLVLHEGKVTPTIVPLT